LRRGPGPAHSLWRRTRAGAPLRTPQSGPDRTGTSCAEPWEPPFIEECCAGARLETLSACPRQVQHFPRVWPFTKLGGIGWGHVLTGETKDATTPGVQDQKRGHRGEAVRTDGRGLAEDARQGKARERSLTGRSGQGPCRGRRANGLAEVGAGR